MENLNTQKLLSIVTATYNNADLLPRFFESILTQEYQNWELIIINDGSTDNTGEICRKYGELDSRIRFYEQSNQGQAVARNWALELVSGEYIAFLDADDSIKPKTYIEAIRHLDKNLDCDIVAYPVEVIHKDERFTTKREGNSLHGSKAILEDLLINKSLRLLITDKLYHSHLLKGLRFVPRMLFDDNLMMIQIARRAKGICFSSEGGYEYHQEEYHPNKNDWTPHKEESKIFINCKFLDELSGDSSLRNTRAKVYQMIGNQSFSYIKNRKPTPKLLKEYLKAMPIGDALCNSVLSPVHKCKLLFLKLYSQI